MFQTCCRFEAAISHLQFPGANATIAKQPYASIESGDNCMKFGIFYEHQLPRNWDEDSEHKLFKQSLDQIELADKLGFDYAWEVEHHFLEEYSHSSAPEVFLGAASQRTKNIRLGHGIIQITTNHPARVAEKVATLDLVSDGRVDLGLGEGASVTELHPFNLRFRDKRDVWEDGVRCVLPMFWNHGWEYEGEYFKFPKRAIVPKPLQKPHPPLWVACSQLDTIRYAAHRGMGSLCFKFADLNSARAWVNAYYNTYLRDLEKLCDYQTNPNIAVVSGFMCAETDEEAWRKADGWTFFQFALQLYNKEGPFEPGSMNFWDRYQEWKQTPAGQKRTGSELIGSPDTIRARLAELEAANVDQVILLNQAGKNTHEDICSSLQLFAREVMPEFHAREAEHQKWKDAVLAGEIELEDIDTTPYNFAARGKPTLKSSKEARSMISGAAGRPSAESLG
jgi:alkanesulfonate monooxygenase SsuD/methylene tetrahydromethanopterin reductase-like flavin-dependent oxidoreductase (luciferase family)